MENDAEISTHTYKHKAGQLLQQNWQAIYSRLTTTPHHFHYYTANKSKHYQDNKTEKMNTGIKKINMESLQFEFDFTLCTC